MATYEEPGGQRASKKKSGITKVLFQRSKKIEGVPKGKVSMQDAIVIAIILFY